MLGGSLKIKVNRMEQLEELLDRNLTPGRGRPSWLIVAGCCISVLLVTPLTVCLACWLALSRRRSGKFAGQALEILSYYKKCIALICRFVNP